MPADLRLDLIDSGSNVYSFTFQGRLIGPTWVKDYRPNADPPELIRATEVLEVEGARILGDTVSATWTNLRAFLSAVLDRTGTPIRAARIVNAESGSDVIEHVLGPTSFGGNHQQFRVEVVAVGEIPRVPAAKLRSVVPVDIRLSAVRVFPDSRGILDFEQRTSNTYPEGLHRVERITRIVTPEGTDAAALARIYARLRQEDYSDGAYLFETLGPDGIEYELEDDDSWNDGAGNTFNRTVTIVTARSVLQRIHRNVGASASGLSGLRIVDETITQGSVTTTVRTASATGPTSRAAVLAAGNELDSSAISFTRLRHSPTHGDAEAEWRVEEQAAAAGNSSNVDARFVRWEMVVRLSGGTRVRRHEVISGGSPARLQEGGFLPFRLDVRVTARRVGASPNRLEIPLPPVLVQPWVLMSVTEDAIPRLESAGSNPGADRYARSAELVYEASVPPPPGTLEPLRSVPTGGEARTAVETYLLTGEYR